MAVLAVVGLRDLNGRQFDDYGLVRDELDRYLGWISKVISGGARGTDRLAIRWAKERGIPYEEFLPDLARHGSPLAYFVRNHKIGRACHLMVAFWDEHSRGTRDAIDYAQSLGRPVDIIKL
jgi:hypothetical protein